MSKKDQAIRILDIKSVNEVRKLVGLRPLPREEFYCKTKGCNQVLNLEAFLQGSYCSKCRLVRQAVLIQKNRLGILDGEKQKKRERKLERRNKS